MFKQHSAWLLLMIRHFAEPCGLTLALTFFPFSGLLLDSRLLCYLAPEFNENEFRLTLYGSQEASTMTSQPIQRGDNGIDAELDQLTYSAYLLTLDPDLALSVVSAALDGSMDDLASRHDLLQRTVEISLGQLRPYAAATSDRKSWAVEASLYSDSSFAMSKRALALKEQTNGNPVLLLDSDARIAFVLHHVLGYSINAAAAMAQISEKEYHEQLRKAYLQLASLQLGAYAVAANTLGQIALA
jgi:hypothetical protein